MMLNFPNSSISPNHEISFAAKMGELVAKRNQNLRTGVQKPSIAILGAGVSGLFQAIIGLVNGNPVKVVEKRTEYQEGRSNGIILTKEAVDQLKNYGVYQYLAEQRKFGSSPNEDRFPVSVCLKDLEGAMKKIIALLIPQTEVILYESHLDRVVKKSAHKVDLLLKSRSGERRRLPQIDLLIIAEGSKSHTAENILKGRRIEVLPPVPVIGGIFEDNRPAGKSFNFNLTRWGAGIVVFTPGLCSVGCLPSPTDTSPVKVLNQRIQKGARNDEHNIEKAKKELLAPRIDLLFRSEEAKNQRPPSFEQARLLSASTISCNFTLPYCGKLGPKTLFFLTGDALFQIDATSGRGASNALESAKEIIPALNGGNPDQILGAYDAKSAEQIEKNMKKTKCLRSAIFDLEIDDPSFSFSLFQLEHRALVEKVQKITGNTVAKLFFQSKWGEKCFRWLVQTVDSAKESGCAKRLLRRIF